MELAELTNSLAHYSTKLITVVKRFFGTGPLDSNAQSWSVVECSTAYAAPRALLIQEATAFIRQFQYSFFHLRLIQWKGSNHKQSARWQHVSWLRAGAFYIW